MTRFSLTFLVLVLPASSLAQESPRLAKERIILRTNAGDLVLALYPDVAPKTVEQVLKLAKLGVYDQTPFYRVHPGFVAQVHDHHYRLEPLNTAQKEAIKKIPGEFSATLKHRKGTLSMARHNDPNSAESSFSIYLGDSPHVDGKYTIFGHLEKGWDVVEQFLAVPVNERYEPVKVIKIIQAEVVESKEAADRLNLAAARPIGYRTDEINGMLMEMHMLMTANGILVGTLILIVLMGLAGYFFYHKIPPRRMVSLILLMVLVSSFVLLIALVPFGHLDPSGKLPIAIFGGLLGLFKLMGRFESPE